MRTNRKPTYAIHAGWRIPMGFPLQCFISGLDYQAQPHDTFIVTYPKCGTTWVQHIVWLLQHEGQPLVVGQDINRAVPHLEEVGSDYVRALPQPRFIKTHFPYAVAPQHPEAKYIYIARNPFDCAVSFYHHTQGFERHYDFAAGTFDEFFECFIAGEVDWGDYFDHLIPWYAQKDRSNLLFLTYEDMIKNTRAAVIKITHFLGSPYPNHCTEETLENVLHHASFTTMSQDQSRWSSPRAKKAAPFIRKGQVGDWKNHFSSEQITRLSQKFQERTAGTDIATLWSHVLPQNVNF